jgi:hypothetical protein
MAENEQPQEIKLKDFLEKVPPGILYTIIDLHVDQINSIQKRKSINIPELYLYCNHKNCNGYRIFKYKNKYNPDIYSELKELFLEFICKNCESSSKVYALFCKYSSKGDKFGEFNKFGELPEFGPPIPAKAISLIGPDRDLFLTGRRAENQGMGIGSFVYYRRVVENQKNRIFDEIIRVLQKISPDDPIIKDLENAKSEIRFSKAVDTIKHALPQSLHINGYNPLTLLHSALSGGVHEHSESECLELATSIRTIIFEFAERLGQALKDEAELNAAVARLAKKR